MKLIRASKLLQDIRDRIEMADDGGVVVTKIVVTREEYQQLDRECWCFKDAERRNGNLVSLFNVRVEVDDS